MRFITKILKLLLVLLGVGLGAMAGRPLPLWRLLPILLIATLLPAGGCYPAYNTATFAYKAKGLKVKGDTTSPVSVTLATANAEAIRADAYAVRKCSDDPSKCRAVALSRDSWFGGGWGNSWLDTPAGYTWAGIQAVGGASGGNQLKMKRKIEETEVRVKALVSSQENFQKSLLKRGKRRKK